MAGGQPEAELMRAILLAATFVLVLLPVAAAQAPSDGAFDTSPPADDTTYWADAPAANATTQPAANGTVSDADFDTSAPATDASYLASDGAPASIPAAPADTTTDSGTGSGLGSGSDAAATTAPATGAAKAPGFELVALAGAAALVAIALRRR